MELSDTTVTMHPYLKVSNENLESFKRLAQDLLETTRGEMGCLYYGFSYSDGEAFCRVGYKNAESLLAHKVQKSESAATSKEIPESQAKAIVTTAVSSMRQQGIALPGYK